MLSRLLFCVLSDMLVDSGFTLSTREGTAVWSYPDSILRINGYAERMIHRINIESFYMQQIHCEDNKEFRELS